MIKRIGVLTLICGAMNLLWAQGSAETYFHGAAQQFIQGEQGVASEMLAEGLSSYPNDPDLLALKALMEQPPTPQPSQQQQEGDEQQDQQDQQDPSQNQSDQQDQQQNQDQQSDNNSPPDGGNPQNQADQAQAAETMSKKNVDHLLDALQQHEGQVQERVRAKQRPRSRAPSGKDW